MQSHSSPGRRLKTMQIPWQKVSWYAAADIDAAPRPLEYSTQRGDFEPDLILQYIFEVLLFTLLVQRSNEGLEGHTRVCKNQRKLQSGCNTQHWSTTTLLVSSKLTMIANNIFKSCLGLPALLKENIVLC